METREHVIEHLATQLASLSLPHPVRVAIDGIDAAGKSTLADELVQPLQSHGREVIRVSIDAFQYPRAIRYRQGNLSAKGYYEDAFDYPQLVAVLLTPLGPSGSRLYRAAVCDYRTDSPILETPKEAALNAILLCDGVFLLRPELHEAWDYRIFVEIDFTEGLRRALQRDGASPGQEDDVRLRYEQRYYAAQHSYLQEQHPQQYADVIFLNQDPQYPVLSQGSDSVIPKSPEV